MSSDGELSDTPPYIPVCDSSDDSEPELPGDQRGELRFFEVISVKGKSLLSQGGFEYGYEADSKTNPGKEYWKCPRRPPYCKGRIMVDHRWNIEENRRFKFGVIINGEHFHPASDVSEPVI